MNIDDLVRLSSHVRLSAFRLEMLPQYLVPQEAEEFTSWSSGSARPSRTPDSHQYLAELRRDVSRGIHWYRVHILDQLLSPYLRFELCGYLANQEAGEEIYVVDRDTHPDLAKLHEDFWLYDDETGVRMVYDDEGRFLRPELVENIERYREMRDIAMRCAESLNDYLTRKKLTQKTLRMAT